MGHDGNTHGIPRVHVKGHTEPYTAQGQQSVHRQKTERYRIAERTRTGDYKHAPCRYSLDITHAHGRTGHRIPQKNVCGSEEHASIRRLPGRGHNGQADTERMEGSAARHGRTHGYTTGDKHGER